MTTPTEIEWCPFKWESAGYPHAHKCKHEVNHWQLVHECQCGAVTIDLKEAPK